MDEEKDNLMYHDQAIATKLQRLAYSATYRFLRKRMLDMLGLEGTQALAVCDVGCGEGSFCRDIRPYLPVGSTLIGIDTSPFVLDIAKAEEAHRSGEPVIQYHVADAVHLPFADASFDIVICANMLKYVQTPQKEENTLQEQVRVLRSGGQLLVVDSDDDTIQYEGVDPDLNATVVKVYAALQGDPKSGSRLERHGHALGLRHRRQERIVLEETVFSDVMAGSIMAQNIHDVVIRSLQEHPEEPGVTREHVTEWYRQIEASANNGSYGWRYVKYALIGRKPG